MSNPYYSNTGYPQFRAPGKSEDMRTELKRIEGGMDRLPDPIMPNQPVFGNASGTGMMMKDKESAKALLDLDKVDNTSDADKPISTKTAAALETKADAAETTAALATKADKTYVDAGLADKADKTYVDAGLADKADITYVDAGLADKADKTYVDAGLASTQAAVALLPTVSDFNIAGNIINGDYQIAQEGTTHNTQGYGSLDGVFLNRVGSTMSVSQQSFTLGQTEVPGEPVNYARFTVNSVAGANNIAQYQHRIPDVRNYAGGKCYVAFDAKADVAGKAIGVGLVQNFGTGGSADVFTPVQIKTLSNTWTGDWHVFEFDVPSIAGKIIGTDRNDHIAVLITFDAGSSYSEFTDVGQKSGVYDICKLRVVRNLWELNHYRQDYYDALMDCYPYFQLYDFGSSTEKMRLYFTWAAHAGTSWPGIEMVLHVPMIKKPVATYTGYSVSNCTLTSIFTGKQFCTIRVRAEAIGSYIISGGTLTLDARV